MDGQSHRRTGLRLDGRDGGRWRTGGRTVAEGGGHNTTMKNTILSGSLSDVRERTLRRKERNERSEWSRQGAAVCASRKKMSLPIFSPGVVRGSGGGWGFLLEGVSPERSGVWECQNSHNATKSPLAGISPRGGAAMPSRLLMKPSPTDARVSPTRRRNPAAA